MMTEKKPDDATTDASPSPTPIPGVDPLKHDEPAFNGGDEDLPPEDPQMGVAMEQS